MMRFIKKGFRGSQVVNEQDTMEAVFDYMALQVDGRFRVQFPQHGAVIDELKRRFTCPENRESADLMIHIMRHTIADLGGKLTTCMLNGCTNNTANHEFMREAINLMWDARKLTEEWLKKEVGIVPGQSTN